MSTGRERRICAKKANKDTLLAGVFLEALAEESLLDADAGCSTEERPSCNPGARHVGNRLSARFHFLAAKIWRHAGNGQNVQRIYAPTAKTANEIRGRVGKSHRLKHRDGKKGSAPVAAGAKLRE
jgi:hypothetical protein